MLRIGLTGGVASGKSAVARIFSSLGVAVVDTDLIARELTRNGSPLLAQIRLSFGDAITRDGNLDRKRLRELIFADTTQRKKLEALLHPPIRSTAAARLFELEQTGVRCVVVVVPLLAEHFKQWKPLLDCVLVVDCDPASQIERLLCRDSVNTELAQAMLNAQATRTERTAIADKVLNNEGSLAELERGVRDLCAAWCKGAAVPLNPDNPLGF